MPELRLLLLAAIWGASFLFMRIAAPQFGPWWMTELRVGLSGVFILIFSLIAKKSLLTIRFWKQFLILGLFFAAIPYTMFAFAALHLPSGYSAILNATTPLFTVIIASFMFKERLTLKTLIAVAIGLIGVMFLVRLGPVTLTPVVVLSILACLGAAICYGVAANFTKRYLNNVSPIANTTNSLVFAALILIGPASFSPIKSIHLNALVSIVLLAVLCTSVAYLIYFDLIKSVGVIKTSTVTFLIPVFAILWGAIFLGEIPNISMLIGLIFVISAIILLFRKTTKN